MRALLSWLRRRTRRIRRLRLLIGGILISLAALLTLYLVITRSLAGSYSFHELLRMDWETETGETGETETGGSGSGTEVFEKRKDKVRQLCKWYHLGNWSFPNRTNGLHFHESPTPQYSYFFVNQEHKFAWCPVYKAGSTSWLHNMMLLKGFNESVLSAPPKQLSIWAREVYGDGEPNELFATSKKLLIVRHPFERLVSAYRDKLSNSTTNLIHGTYYFYEKYGRKIVGKFRPLNSNIVQKEPTFPEFVQYLISTSIEYFDDHWLPVYFTCTPCRLTYDWIAKVETYMVDQQLVIKAMGFDQAQQLKPKWKHKTGSSTDNKNTRTRSRGDSIGMSERTRNYMVSQLTDKQIQLLYDKYKLDFELFGYTI